MNKGAEGEYQEQHAVSASVEIEANYCNQGGEENCVAEYPAIADLVREEVLPHRLVYDIRKKRADEQNTNVNAAGQRVKPRRLSGRGLGAWGAFRKAIGMTI